MWKRTVNGKVLHFYLAGINNQNFLMRDRQTGTWWQQVTGKAIFGPLKGASLELVSADELTFGEWKSEVSGGKVLAPVPSYIKKYDSNWEPEVAKLPLVISFPGTELKSRDVVVGLEIDGAARAYPWDALLKQSPIMDRLHGTPVLIAIGPDGKSFRAFISRIAGKDAEFFLKGESESDPPRSAGASSSGAGTSNPQTVETAQVPENPTKSWALVDATTASEWNFQGCAVSGPSRGICLERLPVIKDFWFDWRNYHSDTTIYKR